MTEAAEREEHERQPEPATQVKTERGIEFRAPRSKSLLAIYQDGLGLVVKCRDEYVILEPPWTEA